METQDQKMTVTQEAPKPTPQPVQPQQEAKPVARRTNKELLDFIVETGESGKDYARQVVEQEIAKDLFDQDWRLARVFAESNVFDGIKGMTQQQAIATAMAKIQLGRNWNLTPADAMRFIYFTNGKPSLETEMHASKLQDAGYDWDVAFEYESLPPATAGGRKRKKCIGCTIFPKKRNKDGSHTPLTQVEYTDSGSKEEVPLAVSFTRDDADEAMIWEGGKQIKLSEKWNFKSWAEDMYFWRALSKFRRRHAPSILRGSMTREEAEEIGQPVKASIQEGTLEAAHAVLKQKLEDLDITQQQSKGGGEVASEQVATAKDEEQTASGHAAGTTMKSPSAPATGLFEGGLGGKRK